MGEDTMGTNVEFPCDTDLKPLLASNQLDMWQAMTLTGARNIFRTQQRIAEVEATLKKVQEAVKMAPPQTPKIHLVPSFSG